MEGARTRPIWLFLTGPYAVLLLFLLLIPFANVAMYSLHPYSPTKVFLPELTLDNYTKIFDLYYLRLFGRTLRLGLITTAVCVVLGYPLAYFLARALPRVQALCLFLLIMPLMVSAVIRIFGWIVILGRKGLLNQALVALGLEPVKLLYGEVRLDEGKTTSSSAARQAILGFRSPKASVMGDACCADSSKARRWPPPVPEFGECRLSYLRHAAWSDAFERRWRFCHGAFVHSEKGGDPCFSSAI